MNDKKQWITVGEMAKKMNVSVRTIQYYDQMGLLPPSAYTEGGRRLYSMEDYVVFHQIISLKEFGFSLQEIKSKLIPATNLEEIDDYLSAQEIAIQNEIKKLKQKKTVINKFKNEMKQINYLDWELFVEILAMLRNDDEHYWIVKHFDKDVYERIKEQHHKKQGEKFLKKMINFCDQAMELQKRNIPTDHELALQLATNWWDAIMAFTDGDMEMIQQMTKLSEHPNYQQTVMMSKFKHVEQYITDALKHVFDNNTRSINKEKNND
jgi:DNA-binding transcriptional MerR regulator